MIEFGESSVPDAYSKYQAILGVVGPNHHDDGCPSICEG